MVELGTGKTDENGQANHEECNDRQLSAQKGHFLAENLTRRRRDQARPPC
jgi:hypothetical protein